MFLQEGKDIYSKVLDAVDICQCEKQEGLTVLRDLMATAKYELMEEYSKISRTDIGNAKEYWDNFLDDLVNQMFPYYDYEIENSSQYIDKNEITYLQVFAHLKNITPNTNNAFLFNKRLR